MAANLTDHAEIKVFQTVSGNTDLTQAEKEKAAQTFLNGVPVMVDVNGFVQEWDLSGSSGAGIAPGTGLLGIALFGGANLASSGLGAPGVFAGLGPPGSSVTYGKVPYEPLAVNIPPGAPFSEGRTYYNPAINDILFIIQVDNSAFAVPADATPVQADINKEFGLSKDATGHWYLDRAKTTVATNTVAIVRGIDPRFGSILNGFVFIVFKDAVSQFQH